MPHTQTRLALALALMLAATGAFAGDRENVRADDAVRVVRQIQAIPESAIPDRLLDDAKAIVVVPDTIKAGFMIGGRRGLGLMSVKSPDGTWSNPVFVKLADLYLSFFGQRICFPKCVACPPPTQAKALQILLVQREPNAPIKCFLDTPSRAIQHAGSKLVRRKRYWQKRGCHRIGRAWPVHIVGRRPIEYGVSWTKGAELFIEENSALANDA